MERQLIKPYIMQKGAELGAALSVKVPSLVGADAGELAGIGTLGIKVSDDLNAEKDNFDLLIDFTRPKALLNISHFVSLITKNGNWYHGFDDAGKVAIQAASEKLPLYLPLTLA